MARNVRLAELTVVLEALSAASQSLRMESTLLREQSEWTRGSARRIAAESKLIRLSVAGRTKPD